MGTMNLTRAAAAAAVVCLGMAGCAADLGGEAVTPQATTAAPASPTSGPSADGQLLGAATQVRDALRDEDYDALAALASPDETVVFEPYSYVTDGSLRLSPQEISQLGTSSTVYTWGAYDGSGEPMDLTFADYRSRFVWDRDYTDAPSVAVDDYLVSGNSLQNLAEYFGPTARWVEYSFPATEMTDDVDPETWDYDHGPPGADWSALRLVFRATSTGYELIGVVHDSWTI